MSLFPFKRKSKIDFYFVYECLTCMVHLYHSADVREGHGLPGIGIMGPCEPQCGCWEESSDCPPKSPSAPVDLKALIAQLWHNDSNLLSLAQIFIK